MGDAFLSSYYSLYFIRRSMDAMQQSILLALTPLALAAGCILFSFLAKSQKASLWLFRGCALMEAILVIIFAYCTSFPVLVVMAVLLGLFNGAPFAIIEGYLVPIVKSRGGNYSSIRLFGSLGYIVALAMGYFLLSNMPIENAYYFSFGFFLIAFFIAFLLHPVPDVEDQVDEVEQAPNHPYKKNAVLFILFSALLYGTFNGVMALLPVRLVALSFTDAHYSLARSISIIIEVAVLLLMPLLNRFFTNRRIPLYIAGGLILIATLFGGFIDQPYALAYLCMGLSSIGKAFLFSYQSLYLGELVGQHRIAGILTVAYGANNVVTALTNIFSSTIYESLQFSGYFFLMGGIEVLGIGALLALTSANLKRVKEKSVASSEADAQ